MEKKRRQTPRMISVDAVLAKSTAKPTSDTVKGYDFNRGVDYHELLLSYTRTGFQATSFGKAVDEINKMIDRKLEPMPRIKEEEWQDVNPFGRKIDNCTIFLSFTSNMVSSGMREHIKYLAEHNMIDCIVTSAGGVEDDIMKCFAPIYLGEFNLKGKELREKGINRIGNLLTPNDNFCQLEEWLLTIFEVMLKEQNEEGTKWTPSKMIRRFGKEINNTESFCYWAYKNNIPILCPAITDGSIGDMLFFDSFENPGFVIDVVEDLVKLNTMAIYTVHSAMILLGGGVSKHHICNANLMRNGADFAVFVNTGQEFDGSDSGASPDEELSWGNIRSTATPVKVHGDASLIFPLLVAETFARRADELIKV